MKHGFVKVALCTPPIQAGATDQNRKEIIKAIRNAAEKRAELIVFGRLSLSGTACGNMYGYNNLLQGCIDSLISIMLDTQNLNCVVFLGLPFKMDNRIYDCTAILNKGRVVALLPNDNPNPVFSCYPETETTHIRLNEDEVPFSKRIVFYHPELGYSIRLMSGTPAAGSPNAEICVEQPLLTRGTGVYQDLVRDSAYLSKHSKCCHISVGAGQGEFSFGRYNSSHKIISELSETLAHADDGAMVVAEVDVSGISHTNTAASGAACAYGSYLTVDINGNNNDLVLDRIFPQKPLAPKNDSECMELIRLQCDAVFSKMRATGCEQVILGVSGGLDSAAVLLVCHRLFLERKLPADKILAVTMPGPASGKRTARNAKKLIELLGVQHIQIPISGAVRRHLKEIGHADTNDIVYENAQARERTQILLDLSNKTGALMLGTGNLSEAALGFCTYGGDQLAQFNPNGFLTKTAIREMAAYWIRTIENKDVARVLKDILKTPVSPELKADQQTEQLIGPYELHDFFLDCLVHKGYCIDKTVYVAERAFRQMVRTDIIGHLGTFVSRFFKNRFKQNFACDAVETYPDLSNLLLHIRSDFSEEQWQKELNNIR